MLSRNLQFFKFTTGKMLNIPIVDISNFLQLRSSYEKECKVIVDCLKNYGAALIRDPRILTGQFNEFFDLMEKYFHTRSMQFKSGKKVEDVFPQYLYQSGLAPIGSEKQINYNQRTADKSYSVFTKKLLELNPESQIIDEEKTRQIQMLRLRWRIGDKPKGYRLLDPPRFHPKDFPTFAYTLDRTANYFQQSLFAVAQMCAVGLDLPIGTFTKKLYGGPDILGPTGIDMSELQNNEVQQLQNMRYHYAFLEIQGNPRYPGLNIWYNNGEKHEAHYPKDVCLIQAGLEFEILTGGYIPAGHYDVVKPKEITENLKEKNKNEPWKNWRVSSTLFSHVKHNLMLSPLDKFKSFHPYYEKMKPIQAYDLFSQEVKSRFAVSFGDEMKSL